MGLRFSRIRFQDEPVRHASQGFIVTSAMSSKSRVFQVARGIPNIIAWAAIKVSNWRDPTRCSEIRTLDPNSPHVVAWARSKETMRFSWRSIRRVSQGKSRARFRAPDVVRMPIVSSATTIVESNVSFRWAKSQSTTLFSGTGLVSSLKTLISPKIIELEWNGPVTQPPDVQINFGAEARHFNQLVNPVVAPIPQRGRKTTLAAVNSPFGFTGLIQLRLYPYYSS